MKKNLNTPLSYAIATLVFFVLESATTFDHFFQSPLFHHGNWLISEAFHTKWKTLLYTAPKIIIGIIGGTFLLVFLFSTFTKNKKIITSKKPALLIFLSIACIPTFVATLKMLTGVYSPIDLLPYGGKFQHIGFIEQLWLYGQTAGGRSFPAGHASGGFSLMALYYLPVNNIWKKYLFFVGFSSGWLMGIYQMARGEHFLSHTMTILFVALWIISCLAKWLRLR